MTEHSGHIISDAFIVRNTVAIVVIAIAVLVIVIHI